VTGGPVAGERGRFRPHFFRVVFAALVGAGGTVGTAVAVGSAENASGLGVNPAVRSRRLQAELGGRFAGHLLDGCARSIERRVLGRDAPVARLLAAGLEDGVGDGTMATALRDEAQLGRPGRPASGCSCGCP
jgi:hypothetical protein